MNPKTKKLCTGLVLLLCLVGVQAETVNMNFNAKTYHKFVTEK